MEIDANNFEFTAYDKASIVKTIYQNPYIPFRPYYKQTVALALANHSKTDINDILLGGAAFGGKTFLLSAMALQYVENSNYRCLVTRRNYRELIGTSSIFENIVNWCTAPNVPLELKPSIRRTSPIKITFPSGAEIVFKSLQDERAKNVLKGESYVTVENDETSELDDGLPAFEYRSIRKNKDETLPLRVINASNPGGPSTDYLIKNYLEGERPYVPLSWRDNPYIDKDQYRKALLQLPKMDRAFQMDGDFYYKPKYGFLLDGEDFDNQVVSEFQGEPLFNVVSADMASTGKDTTALTSLTYSSNGKVYLTDTMTIKSSKTESFILKFLGEQIEKYNTYMYVIEEEPASAATYANRYWSELIYNEYPNVTFTGEKPVKSKFNRSRLSARYLTENKLFIVKDKNTETLRDEFMYIHPDKEEMKKHPSPDLLDSLNQGLYRLDKFMNKGKTSQVNIGKVY